MVPPPLADPGLLACRDKWIARLRALFDASGPCLRPLRLQGVYGQGRCDPYVEPERWVAEALGDLATKADALCDAAVFRPLVVEFGPYGVHFIDALFGADVFELAPGNWQSHPLTSPVGRLERPDLAKAPAWRLARRAAAAFVDSGATVPYFGMPTIASVLNVAVNLYDEAFLVALLDDPAAARRDLAVIHGVLLDLHAWYRATVPQTQLQPVVAGHRTQPPGHGQLCGCTTHLLSAGQYAEFVAPLDAALLAAYPCGGMIHLCGRHTQHIPAWRTMLSLRAVQLNDRAAADLSAYVAGLRPDQAIYLNPCAAMPAARALALASDHPLVLVGDEAAIP
jgi:hypothetical protein